MNIRELFLFISSRYRSRRGLTHLFAIAIGKSPLTTLSLNFDFQEIILAVGYHNDCLRHMYWQEKKLYGSTLFHPQQVGPKISTFSLSQFFVCLFVTCGVMLEKYVVGQQAVI